MDAGAGEDAETYDPQGLPSSADDPVAREDDSEDDASAPEATQAGSGGEEGETSDPGVLNPVETEGRDLTLDDVFDPDDSIKEDLYDVATVYEQKGLGADVRGGDELTFELRLGNRYEKFTFSAGQANNSESSDLVMRVQIYENGDSGDAENISFNETKPFEVDVTNVNALKVVVSCRDGEGDDYSGFDSITAVLYGLRLE